MDNILKEKFNSVFDEEKQNFDEALFELKNLGATQNQSSLILIQELQMPLAKADEIVINSPAWNDMKDSVNKLRNDWFDFLDNC